MSHTLPGTGRAPEAPHRQDPVRHLHRGDALLSERHLPARGREGRAEPAARRGNRRTPPGPGRVSRRRPAPSAMPGRHRAAQDGGARSSKPRWTSRTPPPRWSFPPPRSASASARLVLTSQADRRHLPRLRSGSSRPATTRSSPSTARGSSRPPSTASRPSPPSAVARRQARGLRRPADPVGDQPGFGQRHRGDSRSRTRTDALEIGFNSRYLLDITGQVDGDTVELKLADPGSPTLIQDPAGPGALYVLMPMRV